jgi:short-subunit dehydrogenase
MEKVVVVSGGSKGIGRAICLKFISNGYQVITCARNLDSLEELNTKCKTDFGKELLFCKADVSKKKEVQVFIDFIKSKTSKVDVLINNAGMYIPGKILEEDDDVFEQTMETNLYSAYYLTRGLNALVKKSSEADIYNICSTASIMPYENGGSYCISKYALYGMTKVLREELKEENVRVTAVLPGATFTSSWEGVDLPPERFMKPEDVADSIWSAHQLSRNTVVEEILIRPQLGDI